MCTARLLVLSLGLLGLSACEDYPRDPNETLERVLARETMRVVAVDHGPWVVADAGEGERGAEVELIRAFAQDLGVAIEWHHAPAFEALDALGRGDADLVIGGFTKSAVQAHGTAANTYVYFTEVLIVAAEAGEPVPDTLDGRKVHVPPELMAEGLVEEKDGIPVPEPSEGVHLVALPHWQLPEHDLVPTGIVLHRSEHVMAVPPGENAWVMRLERFLREQAGDVGARLREHAS